MLIKNSNFYQDISSLTSIISSLEFKDAIFGQEVESFKHLPPGIEDHISIAVGHKIVIAENSGIFRKPYAPVHFENFTEKSILVLAVALEETTFCTCQHLSGIYNAQEVENFNEFMANEILPEKWSSIDTIKMKPNDFVVFNPWMWHTFSESKLIQVFYLDNPEAA